MESANLIRYGCDMKKPNNWKPLTISFDAVDRYDFTKHFFEYIIKAEYVHLYFDFDSLETDDELREVLEWCDKLKTVFGEYAYGGYTTNVDIGEKYGLGLIEDAHHVISIHICFYETMIKADELVNIMAWTKSKGFHKFEVHPKADYNVYKIKTRQLMRHVLSNKFYGPGDEKNAVTAGLIHDDLEPSKMIIQIRGDEKLIERDEWVKVFPPKLTKTEVKQQQAIEKKITKMVEKRNKEQTIDDVNYDDKLIEMDDAELLEFLNNFAPEFDNLNDVMINVLHSSISKEQLSSVLPEWYNSREHTNGTDCVSAYIDKYYEFTPSNKWFFSLLKRIDDKTTVDEYKAKYTLVDETVDINSSKWSYETVSFKVYDLTKGVHRLITDLRGVVGFTTGDKWYIKLCKKGQFYIEEVSDDKLFKMIRYSKPFKGNTKITLEHIVRKYSNYFHYKAVEMSKDNHDGVVNMFQGLKYKPLEKTGDYRIIQPFLNHIRHIICNDDEEKYEYYLKWWASLLQNIIVKNGTMPIVHGAQGSGKSIPAEVFCELFGLYGCKNLDDMEKIFGHFNGWALGLLVCVINEPPEADDKFKYFGKIKARVTQAETVGEKKNVDSGLSTSWLNYTLTTNEYTPIQEERGNRRLIYFATNNSKCGDESYFNRLMKNIQPVKQGEYNELFMRVLLTFMLNEIDVEGWNAEALIRKINANTQTEYNEQLERQYLALNAVERYVVDNWERFTSEEGVRADYISIEGYKTKGITAKLAGICDHHTADSHTHVKAYTLKPREQQPDLWNIIDYKNYHPPEQAEN